MLAATSSLGDLQGNLAELRGDVATGDPQALVERIEALRTAMRAAGAMNETIQGLSDAREALRRDPDPAAAAAALDSAMASLEDELDWRRRAEAQILPGLLEYQALLSGTIGLRQQPVLPREQALYVAACSAGHRDVSLSF